MSTKQTKTELETLVQQLINARNMALDELKKANEIIAVMKQEMAVEVSRLQGEVAVREARLMRAGKEKIMAPIKTNEDAISFLALVITGQNNFKSLEERTQFLADLTQRSWRTTTAAQLHISRGGNDTLVLGVDKDLYLADRQRWLQAFGAIKASLEGSMIKYTWDGRVVLSFKN